MGNVSLSHQVNDQPPTKNEREERRGLRPRELARSLGVAPNVIYSAIGSGELRVWRFGRAIVVQADAVDRWLAEKSA